VGLTPPRSPSTAHKPIAWRVVRATAAVVQSGQNQRTAGMLSGGLQVIRIDERGLGFFPTGVKEQVT
jgi:hypothetical protein